MPTLASAEEERRHQQLLNAFESCPIPDAGMLPNLGLFAARQLLTKLLWYDHVYRQIITLPGIILDAGCWYGQALAVFANLRGIYEPHNYARRVVGFDFFDGLPGSGQWACPPGYADYLRRLLALHEANAPCGHLPKVEVIQGDSCSTVPDYLHARPEVLIALALVDFGTETPTRACLEAILPRLVPGGIVAVNPLASARWPGATWAWRHVAERLLNGRRRYTMHHLPLGGDLSYVRLEN